VVGQYYVIATPDSGGWDGDSWDLCGHLPLHKLFEIFFRILESKLFLFFLVQNIDFNLFRGSKTKFQEG
jgi:hypothetical protein